MAKTLGAITTAMSSAVGMENMLGISHDDAVSLRQSIRWLVIDEGKLVIQFYTGTPVALARKLPAQIDEVVIQKLLNGKPLKER